MDKSEDFEPGRVASDDPGSSAKAASRVNALSYKKRIAAAMQGMARESWVIDELVPVCGPYAKGIEPRQSLSPRLTEMEKVGLVYRIFLGYSATGRELFQERTSAQTGQSQQEWFWGKDPNPRPAKPVVVAPASTAVSAPCPNCGYTGNEG